MQFLQLVNGDAKTTRADISSVLSENEDPNFWPSRGRRNILESKLKQYADRIYNKNSLHGKNEFIDFYEISSKI